MSESKQSVPSFIRHRGIQLPQDEPCSGLFVPILVFSNNLSQRVWTCDSCHQEISDHLMHSIAIDDFKEVEL